jgi:hypothetical protein
MPSTPTETPTASDIFQYIQSSVDDVLSGEGAVLFPSAPTPGITRAADLSTLPLASAIDKGLLERWGEPLTYEETLERANETMWVDFLLFRH